MLGLMIDVIKSDVHSVRQQDVVKIQNTKCETPSNYVLFDFFHPKVVTDQSFCSHECLGSTAIPPHSEFA
jgi:hypothetical protein